MAITKTSYVIIGVKNYSSNLYDGHTLPEILHQVEELRGKAPSLAICDRGFRGAKRIKETRTILPEASSGETEYSKRKARKNFRRRSAIEPIIGHLKSDFRIVRNYLKGKIGDAINLLLAAAAFNCKNG